MALLPGEPLVASPRGAEATRPRASMGKKATLLRMAALMVARNCASLSTPVLLTPLAK